MHFTGERQVGKNLSEIEKLHIDRYHYALNEIAFRFNHATTLNIADVGCGVGYGSSILSSSNCNLDAYDISDEAIEFAKEYYLKPNINYIKKNILDVDFLNNKHYNIIVAFEILEHIEFLDSLELLTKIINQSDIAIISIPINNESPFHKYIMSKMEIDLFVDKAISNSNSDKKILNEFTQEDRYYICTIGK